MPEPKLYSVRVKLPEPVFDAVMTLAQREYREISAQIEKFVVEGLAREAALNPIPGMES